jgi:hypothetical protein
MPTAKLPIKITSVNYAHKCSPAPDIQRLAMQKSGRLQPNLEAVKDILELLKVGDIPNSTLRQLLQRRLPIRHTALDDQFLRNFKS